LTSIVLGKVVFTKNRPKSSRSSQSRTRSVGSVESTPLPNLFADAGSCAFACEWNGANGPLSLRQPASDGHPATTKLCADLYCAHPPLGQFAYLANAHHDFRTPAYAAFLPRSHKASQNSLADSL